MHDEQKGPRRSSSDVHRVVEIPTRCTTDDFDLATADR